jgi:RNA polymerase sigma-70 factor (ECF subfamily)
MADSPCAPTLPAAGPMAVGGAGDDPAARAGALVEEHYDFVWRTLRHLGIAGAAAEDGAQEVMCVLARRVDEIAPGAERSFLFTAAIRVAATLRRAVRRHPEEGDVDLDTLAASTPSAEELVDERRAHELLQRVLDAMPVELRIVFVLHEIEELTTPEMAAALGVPLGTATSRLQRSREEFRSIVRRMHAAQRNRGAREQ